MALRLGFLSIHDPVMKELTLSLTRSQLNRGSALVFCLCSLSRDIQALID